MQTLAAVAEHHAKEWKGEKSEGPPNRIESLFTLAKRCVIERAKENPWLPQKCLPHMLQEELRLPGGRGLGFVDSFLADLALQKPDDDEGDDTENADKVTISTVHRAKGLEWNEVYVPFFNEGYMPTAFHDGDDSRISATHQEGCEVRTGGKHCQCAKHYAELKEKRLGISMEQQHEDEERRLAHVAATRARDRLVFLSLRTEERSSFEACLDRRTVPSTAFDREYSP